MDALAAGSSPSPSSEIHPGAGGVVFDARGQVLLVQYRDGSWTFPKGHYEAGETPQQTALREVEEEAGIRAEVLDWLPLTRYTNNKGQARQIDWFLLRAADTAVTLEDTFGAGGFIPVAEASERLSWAEDKTLLWHAETRWKMLHPQAGHIYDLSERRPQVDAGAYIAPTAVLIGDVTVAADASIWPQAVLRGDIEPIHIGARSNVQDGAVLHTEEDCPCILEEDVTVGHAAIVHGAHCGNKSLIGMGAILLSGSRVGRGAVVAAGAVLRERDEVPDGMLAVGVPAKVIGPAPEFGNAAHYVQNGHHYREALRASVSLQSGAADPERE